MCNSTRTLHKARVDTMRALQSKSVFIASQCDDSETKKALNKLAESFRFSDPVSSDALNDIEASLNALVDELQSAVLEKDNAAAQTLCAKVEATLADRNRMCKLNKLAATYFSENSRTKKKQKLSKCS